MTDDPQRQDAALDWLVRSNDPEFDGWDEFTAWLEQDPANAHAYHALAASEAEMRPYVEAVPVPAPAARPAAPPERRRLALVAGVAVLAAAATAIVAPRLLPVDYETAPGEVEFVSLGGRDQLVLNGGTRLELAGWDRRTVRLEQGQVLLRMLEPGAEEIEVFAGDLRIVDVGTVFEVSREGNGTSVAVSEGAVVVDPREAGLRLEAGQGLATEDGADLLRAQPVDPSSVGAFASGQLYYLDEPIAKVLADLRRSTGVDFSASAAIRSRRFSGTLSVAEVKRDPRSLEPLLDVSMERTEQGWKLGGRGQR